MKTETLEQIMDHIHNYFIKEVHKGSFKVESETITLDFLQNGQYFKVVGSVFNDGVFQYPSEVMTDEEFDGEIWSLAVPRSLIDLANEIDSWISTYGASANSPYSSESFGGYSRTKGGGLDSHGNMTNSWQSIFASRLNQWRKIS